MGESIWGRSRRDWWARVESPRGRVAELILTVALSLAAVRFYPDDASALAQVAIQGGTVVGGLLAGGLALLGLEYISLAPRALLTEAREREAARRSRVALAIEVADDDREWRRLRVHNPNLFVVDGVYVRVSGAGGALPEGWVFTWSTHETRVISRTIRIPAKRSRVLDVCRAAPVVDERTHVIEAHIFEPDPQGSQLLAPVQNLATGEYLLEIEVGSDAQDVPVAEYTLEIIVDAAEVRLSVA